MIITREVIVSRTATYVTNSVAARRQNNFLLKQRFCNNNNCESVNILNTETVCYQ